MRGFESPQYDPYTNGSIQKVFVTNPDGSEYIGQVWPGYTVCLPSSHYIQSSKERCWPDNVLEQVFPDWFANNTLQWWTDALRNWTEGGIEFSGIWLDMNEASSFCNGSW